MTESSPDPDEYAAQRLEASNPSPTTDDGVRDTSAMAPADDAPPEQSPGGEETNPEGLEPKADYPSLDPRSD